MTEPGTPPTTSTARRTLVPGAVLAAGTEAEYRALVDGPGETHVELGPAPDACEPVIASTRIGHVTDLHLADVGSPLRLDFPDPSLWEGPVPYAFRPQELLATRASVAAVDTLRRLAVDVVVQTGDAVDSAQLNETLSYLTVFDGGTVDPLVGDPHRSPLAQEWEGSAVWQPEVEANAYSRRFGLPVLPGLLAAAARPHHSDGVGTPWVAARGNHDVLVLGTTALSTPLDAVARGGHKPTALPGPVRDGLGQFLTDAAVLFTGPGVAVEPREDRRLLTPAEFAAAHRGRGVGHTAGHGLASSPEAEGDGRYTVDLGERFRLVVLDTNNTCGMWDGVLLLEQLAWLGDRLVEAAADDRLVVLVSHHGSRFLSNDFGVCADAAADAAALVTTALRHPNVVVWLDGHHHGNQVQVHRRTDGSGFVEITTSSIADWPCQVREVEILERPGTVTVTTTMHHAAVGDAAGIDSDAGLARLHHELAANQYWRGSGRPGATGAIHDRNITLTLPTTVRTSANVTPRKTHERSAA